MTSISEASNVSFEFVFETVLIYFSLIIGPDNLGFEGSFFSSFYFSFFRKLMLLKVTS